MKKVEVGYANPVLVHSIEPNEYRDILMMVIKLMRPNQSDNVEYGTAYNVWTDHHHPDDTAFKRGPQETVFKCAQLYAKEVLGKDITTDDIEDFRGWVVHHINDDFTQIHDHGGSGMVVALYVDDGYREGDEREDGSGDFLIYPAGTDPDINQGKEHEIPIHDQIPVQTGNVLMMDGDVVHATNRYTGNRDRLVLVTNFWFKDH